MNPIISVYIKDSLNHCGPLQNVSKNTSQSRLNNVPFHNNLDFDPTEKDHVEAVEFIEHRLFTSLKNNQIAFTGHSSVYKAYSKL